MQTQSHILDKTYVPLGQRRGISDLAPFSLDLTWGRADTDCAAHTRAYPSPPMSGSPPLPLKPTQEAGDRGQRGSQPVSHDVYRTSTAVPGVEYRVPPPQPSLPPPSPAGGVRPFPPAEAQPYPYARPEDVIGRPFAFQQQVEQIAPQPQYQLPPVAGSSQMSTPYGVAGNPQVQENLPCDAQRPCSRCTSNGKEDACIDVQHKKRGRPRLRDDSHRAFDATRFSHPAEPPIRRPVSLYSPGGVAAVPFDDPLRRSQSYRVLKSYPNEPVTPRYIERGSAVDANMFPPPLSIPQRAVEPVAFLTVDLEFAKASSSFVDAVGSQAIMGRRLVDVVNPGERDRVVALQRALQEEQGRIEPNYLPPIYGKQETERVIQGLPFSQESVSRFQLDRYELLTFATPDGQQRLLPLRIGLAKEDSIYFVVILLTPRPQPFPHPPPSPHNREWSYSTPPQPFTQLTPVSASFGPTRQRFGESPLESVFSPRQPDTPASIMPGPSPGVSPNIPSYAASTAVRGEHPSGTYQIPRSELSAARTLPPTEFQLPPIRNQPPMGLPSDPGWSREDRGSRVDIGGLIDKPDTSRGP
ncbi:hypothetical protein DL764_010113 [Monosporascus ibericus]|uniref:Uncharacterized protein n=1 Tax=Monosporascus ibericus TaxID=155417 RepID=A0A4Q4SW35_9PEZI|nr:hypothetical protein DL764_010113 [Monosporascus ibericus]